MSKTPFKIIYNLDGLSDAEVEKYQRDVSVYFELDPEINWFDNLWMTDPDTGLRRKQLYARRGTTDVLRDRRKISVIEMVQHDGPGYVSFTAKGKDASGRTEIAVGAHSTEGLKGEKLAAAVSTAETRAGRRLTLKFCGLGILDYTEVTDPVEVKASPADLAAVAPAPIFSPSIPTPNAAPGKMVDPNERAAADSTAQALAESVEVGIRAMEEATKQLGLSAVVTRGDGLSIPVPAGALTVVDNTPLPAEAPVAPKARRSRKKNTVDISTPGQVSTDAETIARAEKEKPFSPEQAAIIAIDPLVHAAAKELMPPVACLDCKRPLSEHPLVNSAKVCPVPVQAVPAVSVQANSAVPPQVNPAAPVLASPAVTAVPHPGHMTMTLPTAAAHQPILAPPMPAPPTGFPGQPTPEQEATYREELRAYSNIILPGAGMVPSQGIGGPSAKLRLYAERMSGKPTQQMTVSDWEEFFEQMKSFRSVNGDKGLVKYINDVIGAK